MTSSSYSNSFHPPGYVPQEKEVENLIDMDTLNLHTNQFGLIPTDEKMVILNNQEVSGLVQSPPPPSSYAKQLPGRDEGGRMIEDYRGREDAFGRKEEEIGEKVEEGGGKKEDVGGNFREESIRRGSTPRVVNIKKGWLERIGELIAPTRRFEKVKVKFGRGAVQDKIYRHVGNGVRTTK